MSVETTDEEKREHADRIAYIVENYKGKKFYWLCLLGEVKDLFEYGYSRNPTKMNSLAEPFYEWVKEKLKDGAEEWVSITYSFMLRQTRVEEYSEQVKQDLYEMVKEAERDVDKVFNQIVQEFSHL